MIYNRAAQILNERTNELETMPFMQLVTAWSRMEDVLWQARVRNQRLK